MPTPAEDFTKLTPNEIRARINAIDDERERLRLKRNNLSEALDVILTRSWRKPVAENPDSE